MQLHYMRADRERWIPVSSIDYFEELVDRYGEPRPGYRLVLKSGKSFTTSDPLPEDLHALVGGESAVPGYTEKHREARVTPGGGVSMVREQISEFYRENYHTSDMKARRDSIEPISAD